MTTPAAATSRDDPRDVAGERDITRDTPATSTSAALQPAEAKKPWAREERTERDAEVATPRRAPASEPAAMTAPTVPIAPATQPAPSAVVTAAPSMGDDPWAKVLAAANPNRRLRILLKDITLVGVENDVVVLAVSEALAGAARANEKELCGLLASAWDKAVKLELRQHGQPASATLAPAETQQAINANLQAIQEHPLVKQAIELFGAKLTSVQARKSSKQE